MDTERHWIGIQTHTDIPFAMEFLNFLTTPSNTETKDKASFLKLQNSLGSWATSSPSDKNKKRKRTDEKLEDVQLSPTKKKVVTTTHLDSPDSTPIKQSSQISVISNYESAAKRLNFAIKREDDPAETLPTPEATPQKNTRVLDVLKEQIAEKDSIPLISTPPATPTKKISIDSLIDDKENVSLQPYKQKQSTIYTRGKLLFSRSTAADFDTHLPERQLEADALHNFLVNHITSNQGTSLYISGPPGTGKTAQCKLSLSQFVSVENARGGVQDVEINGKDYRVGYSYINCMAFSKTEGVFSQLYQGLTGEKLSMKQSKEALFKFLSSDKADMSVVILDELDQLLHGRTDEVFTLFSWAVSCKIVLVGISNALDMVDRLLPRLKMNGLSPNTLSFLPYSAEQIAKIITVKLKQLNEDATDNKLQLFHPAAIQLCSRKAASHTGDLRKAFDVCRAAIEVVEKDWRKNAASLDETNLPMVKIQHIARITNAAFNSATVSKLRSLNLSQKYLLCMLLQAEASRTKALTVNSFYEFYIRQVSKDTQIVGILRKPEFLEVLSNLEANSLVHVHKTNRAFSEARISFGVVKQDLMETIKGVYVLEKLMEEK